MRIKGKSSGLHERACWFEGPFLIPSCERSKKSKWNYVTGLIQQFDLWYFTNADLTFDMTGGGEREEFVGIQSTINDEYLCWEKKLQKHERKKITQANFLLSSSTINLLPCHRKRSHHSWHLLKWPGNRQNDMTLELRFPTNWNKHFLQPIFQKRQFEGKQKKYCKADNPRFGIFPWKCECFICWTSTQQLQTNFNKNTPKQEINLPSCPASPSARSLQQAYSQKSHSSHHFYRSDLHKIKCYDWRNIRPSQHKFKQFLYVLYIETWFFGDYMGYFQQSVPIVSKTCPCLFKVIPASKFVFLMAKLMKLLFFFLPT